MILFRFVALIICIASAGYMFYPQKFEQLLDPNYTTIQDDPNAYQVLFIGNSLTYYNNLPEIFQQITASKGRNIRFDSHLIGAATLRQHANNRELQQKIRQGHWDLVVLQEQSQLPALLPQQVQNDVFSAAKKLVDFIRDTNQHADIAFYMTMARIDGDKANASRLRTPELGNYYGMQKRLATTYMQLAQKHKAYVVPVGIAWQYLRQSYPAIKLYSDPVHPNLHGSYLAACTFFSTLYREPCEGSYIPRGILPSTAKLLQTTSDNAVLNSGHRWDWRESQ